MLQPIGPRGGRSDHEAWILGSLGLMFAALPIVTAVAAAGLAMTSQFAGAAVAALVAAGAGWLFSRFLCDVSLRHAWLGGTVLTVSGPRIARHCDLAAPGTVTKLKRTVPLGGYGLIPVLYAREQAGGPPVRLLLGGESGGRPFLVVAPAELRLLVRAISARPGAPGKETVELVDYLRFLADKRERDGHPQIDWSHRTDPGGLGDREQR